MKKKIKELLKESYYHLGIAKVALYEAEMQTLSSEEIMEINKMWWILEEAQKKLKKLI